MSSFHMRRSRLAQLSHAQLVELAAEACEGSHELKNKADALIAQVAPLPAWCVDILLSPDLLPQLFSSLGLSDHAAASVCSTWSCAYTRQLRRLRYVLPASARELSELDDVPKQPNGLCMLPGGVLAIASCEESSQCAVEFVAARADSDKQALAAYRSSSLAAQRYVWLTGLARTNDGLLACNMDDPFVALCKLALEGSMDELTTLPALDDYGLGFRQIAVHQQTERTYVLAVSGDHKRDAVIILDPNLQVIATAEAPAETQVGVGISDFALHGDQVIVLTWLKPKHSGLRLLDLDGRYQRTIAAGKFRSPHAVAASHGRVFVVEDDEDDEDDDMDKPDMKVLHVIDIQSGDILQRVRFEMDGAVCCILADGNEIYIAGFDASRVVVFQLAGVEV